MKSHLKATVGGSSADYSLLFREMFCVTAQALADSVGLPLESLSVTYDHILETGTFLMRKFDFPDVSTEISIRLSK
jgi:hypothetical protein